MRKAILFFVVISSLVALSACQKAAPPAASAKPGPAWAGKIALTTDPAQPVSERPATFRVSVTDAAGQAVAGATVQADLKMQSMDMGKNVVQLADKGNGIYEGKGEFSMAGPWNVIVSVSKTGTTGEQKFEVVAKK